MAVVDLNGDNANQVATEIGGVAHQVDVSQPQAIAELIDAVEAEHGPIDLFCSNAGIGIGEGLDADDETWQQIMAVNFYAHLYAARIVLPRMAARSSGYLLATASAAGLLMQANSVTYTVSKHAAISLAEWISVNYGEQGIGVSVLCPQAVNTPMLAGTEQGGVAGVDGVIEPAAVAQAVVEGLRNEQFLILPHPQVAQYMQRKAQEPDRWLAGMRKLRSQYYGDGDDAGA